MNDIEFSEARHSLDKSQAEIARILGISSRAVQSYEQGWRKIPSPVEKQMLFLLYKKLTVKRKFKSCWEINDCSTASRDNCPAWEFQTGELCWFINGTICGGKVQNTWDQKMDKCRKCNYYRYLFSN